MFEITPFEAKESNYEAMTSIANAVWSHSYMTVENIKYWDSIRKPENFHARYMVRVGEKSVAVGELGRAPWIRKKVAFYAKISVLPAYRGRGIGTALAAQFKEHLVAEKAVLVMTGVSEDQHEGIQFLKKYQFEQVMRVPASHLDLLTFDATPFLGAFKKVEENGITFHTLTELAAVDTDWKQKMYRLDVETWRDVPSSTPFEEPSFEEWQRFRLNNPNFNKDGVFIAVSESGDWVAESTYIFNKSEPEKAQTGMTGVLRAYRRKGVATAIKLHAFRYCRAQGATYVRTNNEENNPMYALNLAFGFIAQPAKLDFHLEIEEAELADK